MGKIDWYILKKLLVTFVFCMVLFMVVAVAVDTSEKADDFARTNLSTGQIITQYYLVLFHGYGGCSSRFSFSLLLFFSPVAWHPGQRLLRYWPVVPALTGCCAPTL